MHFYCKRQRASASLRAQVSVIRVFVCACFSSLRHFLSFQHKIEQRQGEREKEKK